jgi:hypothetical protein
MKRLLEKYNSKNFDKINMNKFKSTCSKFIEREIEESCFPNSTDRIAHFQSKDIVK